MKREGRNSKNRRGDRNNYYIKGYYPSIIDGSELLSKDKLLECNIPTKFDIDAFSPVRDLRNQTTIVSDIVCEMVMHRAKSHNIPDYSIGNTGVLYEMANKVNLSPKEALEILTNESILDMPISIDYYMKVTGLNQMKASLYKLGPVISVVRMRSEDNNFWESETKGRSGYNIILFTGYDDNSKCFHFKNYWGVEYGVGGYYEFPYDKFDSEVKEAWVLL